MNRIRKNSPKAWFLAARPKTLTGAASPVILAIATAWASSEEVAWIPAVLCILFSLTMQVDANFVNDYLDFQRGIDKEDRLGPERACSQGWIELHQMKKGIFLTTLVACLVGLPLIYWGGWSMVLIGLTCVIFCFLYTTSLARLGLGDILVLVFFGLIPVCTTYYLMTGKLNSEIIAYSIAMGLVTDNLLIVNNYRDREADAKVGKKTLVVIIGEKATDLYLFLGILATAIVLLFFIAEGAWWKGLLMLPFLYFHFKNHLSMVRINHGREINKVLGSTSAAIFLFAISVAIARLL